MNLTDLEMDIVDDAYNAEVKLEHARDVITMIVDYFDITNGNVSETAKYNLSHDVPRLSRNLEMLDNLLQEALENVTKAQDRASAKRDESAA